MKLASIRVGKKETYGAVVAGGIVDLGKKFGKKWPTLRLALLGAGLPKLKAYAKGRKPDIKDGKFAWMPVIPDASIIFCAGVNYREHRAETGRPDTLHPTIFTRYA
jgi:2-keto-4-pentenoate hydratase/2-oxohepta-3-ene-1,7-dioic acid hydratase in catechol pathway